MPMDQAVVGLAVEFEIVDVGRAVIGVLELVVGVTPGRLGAAAHAATVAIDEGDPLVAAGQANRTAEMQRLAVGAVHDAHDLGGRAQLEEE